MNKQEFISDMKLTLNVVDIFGGEWPTRPGPVRSDTKEDAHYIVVNGELVIPVWEEHPDYEGAKLVGITKDEFYQAKEIVLNAL